MAEISYRRYRFPPVIIQHAVWVSRATLRIFRAEAANQWRDAVIAV
jgi:hypothetical protein